MQNLLTIELICAATGGFVGAFFAIVFNKRRETIVQGVVSLMIGIIAGAGVGTKFGSDPVWCCFIGSIAGSLGGLFLEGLGKAVGEHLPKATQDLMDSWVIRLGGKPSEAPPQPVSDSEMQSEEK